MKMNWKDESEKSGTFEVYPEGGYVLKATDWEKTAASTGTQQLRFYFDILEPAAHQNKTFIDHFALTDKALWRLADFVGKAGLDLESLGEMEVGSPSFQKVINLIKGRKFGAFITEEAYNGKPRNRVNEYTRIDKTPVKVDAGGDDVPPFAKEGVKTAKGDLV